MPTLERPPVLQKSCFRCEHFDGEGWCALPKAQRTIYGRIIVPEAVVCSRFEDVDSGAALAEGDTAGSIDRVRQVRE